MQTNHLHNNDLFTMFTLLRLLTMVFKFISFTLITSITKGKEQNRRESTNIKNTPSYLE